MVDPGAGLPFMITSIEDHGNRHRMNRTRRGCSGSWTALP